jgi:CRISPR-associated protein Csm3
MRNREECFYKVRAQVLFQFTTAFHIGSGQGGESGTDSGILMDAAEYPVVPGASLKGVFRSTVENLVASLNHIQLWACGLQNGLYSDRPCIGGGVTSNETYTMANKQYQNSHGKDVRGIEKNRCSVCTLFGSPLSGGRLFVSDAELATPDIFRLEHRDGVGLDRDSGTARDGIKYDYDVANSGLFYTTQIEIDHPAPADMALFGMGLLEWRYNGLRLGGKTSRGLGVTAIHELALATVDLGDPEQRKRYLLQGGWNEVVDPDGFLQSHITPFI